MQLLYLTSKIKGYSISLAKLALLLLLPMLPSFFHKLPVPPLNRPLSFPFHSRKLSQED